jgi:hypothetical protein
VNPGHAAPENRWHRRLNVGTYQRFNEAGAGGTVHAVEWLPFFVGKDLHLPALEGLNDWLVRRADAAGRLPRWQGLRVVAGDGSVLMPAVRPCLKVRSPAHADQRLFALFLPGTELMLHAAVFSAQGSERQMRPGSSGE